MDLQYETSKLLATCETANNIADWINVAKQKAQIDYHAVTNGVKNDTGFANNAFLRFITSGYEQLTEESNLSIPTIVTNVLRFITGQMHKKTALIVIDGMSLFDFEVISKSFSKTKYEYDCSFAMIPTVTPISRQSLLSGKYPRELSDQFSLVYEESEYLVAANNFGFAKEQTLYIRGFPHEIEPSVKLAAIILSDIDEIVHNQHQGRNGMYKDLVQQKCGERILQLVLHLYDLGFAVYITADHGNAVCTGVGEFRGDIEVQTRATRMAAIKDLSFCNELLTLNSTEYPGFHLSREYHYFVCNEGVSFNRIGEAVMTHGGMSLDEVIVPFIKIYP